LIRKKDINADITISFDKLNINDNTKKTPYVEATTDDIPLGNLGPHNTIKYYNEIPIFEDELEDCGLSQSSSRFRVMADCFFGLIRFYLRVDEVLVRIYDTRVYHEFGNSYVLREFTWKESTYEELKNRGFKFTSDFHIDHKQSDLIYKDLEVKFTFKDKLYFK